MKESIQVFAEFSNSDRANWGEHKKWAREGGGGGVSFSSSPLRPLFCAREGEGWPEVTAYPETQSIRFWPKPSESSTK